VTGKAIAKNKMTKEQAKQILQLYRPGTADAADPEFVEALEFCEHDNELKEWLANHCAIYTALRAKFKKIPVPEGLKEQIIAERPIQHRAPVWQKSVLLAGALAAIALLISVVPIKFTPRERHDFAAYRTSMGSLAARSYYMDFNTNDLDQIRMYFAQTNAIADYIVPENLKKNATTLGCVSAKWQGKQVSMICFKSGRPLVSGSSSDLWLFVCNRTVTDDTPTATLEKPAVEHSNGIVTASWTAGNRTYLLATLGEDKQLLSQFLPENSVL
jgi:hypothetical protein